MQNPINALDSILADWTSPRVRRLIHLVLTLLLLGLTAWQAADGDWRVALATLAGALYTAANKANTPAQALADAGDDEDGDDPLTYEAAGGNPFPESGFEGDDTDLYRPRL